MEGIVKIIDCLRPIFVMSPKKQEIEMLDDIRPDVQHLLAKSLDHSESARYNECLELVGAVLDLTWEELNTGHWSLVPPSQRNIYAAASLVKVVAQVQSAVQGPPDLILNCLQEAVKTADLGLLMGNSHREQLTTTAHILSQAINQCSKAVTEECETSRTSSGASGEGPQLGVITDPVSVSHSPSLETFSSQHFYPRIPVKITGCINHWPALEHWRNLDYLLEKAGSRTVPVEVGSSYSNEDWSQKLMTFRQFVTQHVCNSSNKRPAVGYLAQHQLFQQVPELRRDIAVPDYCCCSEAEAETDGDAEVDINAWFGPAGTVSPLHHDPKHNLLAQVVGRKRVVLYSPNVSDRLYPHPSRLLCNTAQVDPESPDYRTYPKYRDTPALACLLSPGETLYIPPCWWHHVRALDTSFSVSFWWH